MYIWIYLKIYIYYCDGKQIFWQTLLKFLCHMIQILLNNADLLIDTYFLLLFILKLSCLIFWANH